MPAIVMRWVVIVSVVPTAVLLHPTAHAEAGTAYYINNQAGSNCSDTGPGTSPATPWCDFTPVNSRTFGPGDQILLARRATWDQQMTLNGSGAPTNYASVDAYGSGPRPRIIRNANESDRAIRMNDPSYWSVSNLEIGAAGTGILVYFHTLYHAGLHFNNIYVHDIRGIHQGDTASGQADRIWNSAGIEITGLVAATSTQYALSDVTLSNIEGTHNMDSISFDWFNGLRTTDGGDGHTLVRNVTLDHLYLHDDNGPAGGCDEGMRLVDMMNVVILDSILNDEAGCHSTSGTAAVIFGGLQNVTFVNGIETNVPNTRSSDMTGFDYEANNDQVRVRDSYIGGNAGAGIELLALHGSDDHSISEIAGNVFVGDGNGAVLRLLSMSDPTGTIRDNLYDEPAGLLTSIGADFRAFTVANNIRVPASLISNATHDFSGTQGVNDWSYQSSADGTTWTALTYDGIRQEWTPSVSVTVPLITQFDQQPDSCPTCDVARAWTAPLTGTVSIRARILKSDRAGGDGIGARITKNGVTIWGPASVAYDDQTGIETNLDHLSVVPGDVIRFVVDNGGNGNNDHDLTSWDPSVAYIPAGTAAGSATPAPTNATPSAGAPTAPPRPGGTAVGLLTTARAASCRAMPPLSVGAPHGTAGRNTFTMRVHTVPYARVSITLYALTRHPRLLARMQGSASKRGQFTIRTVLTYRVTKPAQALLTVTIRRGCGRTARHIHVTSQPGHHSNRVRHHYATTQLQLSSQTLDNALNATEVWLIVQVNKQDSHKLRQQEQLPIVTTVCLARRTVRTPSSVPACADGTCGQVQALQTRCLRRHGHRTVSTVSLSLALSYAGQTRRGLHSQG